MRHIPIEWLGEVFLVLAVLGGGGSIGVALCRLAALACSALGSRIAAARHRRRAERTNRRPHTALALSEASAHGC